MKKILKKEVIIAFIIGVLIASGITVYATSYFAQDISYTDKKSVANALDELYSLKTSTVQDLIDNNLEVSTTQMSNISTGITLTRNTIKKMGNVVYINIRGYYSSNIPTTQDFIIGTIPSGYTPTEDLISNANLSNKEWNVNSVGYLYISPKGGIVIRNSNSTNYKYFSIVETYVIE